VIRRLLQRRQFMREHRWTHAHLSGYLDQELGEAEVARAEEHVGVCPQCRRVLATLRRTLASLRELGSPRRPDLAAGIIERLRDEGRI
jgi:anti-sigma factor RsiW